MEKIFNPSWVGLPHQTLSKLLSRELRQKKVQLMANLSPSWCKNINQIIHPSPSFEDKGFKKRVVLHIF